MHTHNKLARWSAKILQLQVKIAKEKESYRSLESGHYGPITVYRTRKTTVKRHIRRGFTAVRVSQ